MCYMEPSEQKNRMCFRFWSDHCSLPARYLQLTQLQVSSVKVNSRTKTRHVISDRQWTQSVWTGFEPVTAVLHCERSSWCAAVTCGFLTSFLQLPVCQRDTGNMSSSLLLPSRHITLSSSLNSAAGACRLRPSGNVAEEQWSSLWTLWRTSRSVWAAVWLSVSDGINSLRSKQATDEFRSFYLLTYLN